MNLTIIPGRLSGTVTPPPSKSQAHRLLLCAALAGAGSEIHNLPDSQDIQATRRCMAALMASSGCQTVLDCGESGSTLRFLIPIALVLRGGGLFTGWGRLMERPQQPYFDIFEEKGVRYGQKDGVLTVRGELRPGVYRLPGNVSSQFITGLLYALPLLDGDSEIVLTTRLESSGYVDMTIEALQQFGVKVDWRKEKQAFAVLGSQTYLPAEAAVEPDWSQAAFWLTARSLGSDVTAEVSSQASAQGDQVIVSQLAWLEKTGDISIDVSDCPDLLPVLAARAALRQGTAHLTNAARLRLKESDRLSSVTAALTALGADVEEHADSLTIHGKDGLDGGTVDCCNDHRIAMMAAIAATRCKEPVTLLGAECVAKSYPDFWEHYRKLGGVFYEHAGE